MNDFMEVDGDVNLGIGTDEQNIVQYGILGSNEVYTTL